MQKYAELGGAEQTPRGDHDSTTDTLNPLIDTAKAEARIRAEVEAALYPRIAALEKQLAEQLAAGGAGCCAVA